MNLTVRFDVDTWSCAHRGIPFLLDYAGQIGARFYFMVNMGRAVSRVMFLRNIMRGSNAAETTSKRIEKLGSLRRLGVDGYLHTAVLNPQVGRTAGHILRQAQRTGHVLGLHGGRNHGEWQWGAHGWSAARLRAEIGWGLAAFEQAGLERPSGFSSPGWNSPAQLPDVLIEQGFEALYDSHRSDELLDASLRLRGLHDINTAFAGEPGGVGYFENCLVRGIDAAAAAEHIVSILRSRPNAHGVVYDHPVFCEGVGQELFRATLDAVKLRGVNLMAPIFGSVA
ncbi:hypothetical protein [Lysobacter capsici]|uniref:hypothetical protein n=1 Tax=Lysobacter capsici TaxID=435897 RepID=UPI001BFFEFD6|nr:hypothetical protein [Lysobacter capsici]QWF16044.1 hypothetical protein KME82_20090 [Lysobacter capsici]